MLNFDIFDNPALRRRRQRGPQRPFHQDVAEARIQRQEEAEYRARIGTFEIGVGCSGDEISQFWSAGVFRILGRSRNAGALPRNRYVQRYVHPDDQERVQRASADAFDSTDNADVPADMTYRLITETGAILDVRESLFMVAGSPVKRVYFGELTVLGAATVVEMPPTAMPEGWSALCTTEKISPSIREAMVTALETFKEAEQRRMTREMHDDFGQLLAAMKLDLCMLENTAGIGGQSGKQQIASLHALVDAMIQSVRRIIAELPPQIVAEHGLVRAIEKLADGFRARSAMRIELSLAAPETRLNESLALAIYRIVQEALNNIARHAMASTAWIVVTFDASHARLRIRDDGKGASVDDLAKPGSFGVTWMRERVVAMRGTIDIQTARGQGTVIEVTLPLRSESPAGNGA